MELIQIECQLCGTIFLIKVEPGKVTCPHCGLTDELMEDDK